MKSASRLLPFLLIVVLAIQCKDKNEPGTQPVTIIPGDFLSGSKYTSLQVQVVYVSGFQPTATSLNNLKSFLQLLLNKPAGISISQGAIASPGKTAYTIEDITSLESLHRSPEPGGTSLAAYIFFADGDYSGNSGSSKVLGIAYGSSSITIFEKTIREFSGAVGKPSTDVLESTVMDHEFGHILGLVNNGTGMQTAHQDTPNGKHCTTQSCLMYYQVETSNFVSNLMGGSVPALDAACAADLKASGGK